MGEELDKCLERQRMEARQSTVTEKREGKEGQTETS
jgi:hypothetical protein